MQCGVSLEEFGSGFKKLAPQKGDRPLKRGECEGGQDAIKVGISCVVVLFLEHGTVGGMLFSGIEQFYYCPVDIHLM